MMGSCWFVYLLSFNQPIYLNFYTASFCLFLVPFGQIFLFVLWLKQIYVSNDCLNIRVSGIPIEDLGWKKKTDTYYGGMITSWWEEDGEWRNDVELSD